MQDRKMEAKEEKLIVEFANLACAFCGKRRFYYRPYAFDCINCGGGIAQEGSSWRYFYPPSKVFLSDVPPNTTWRLGSTGYYSPIIQYDILTGNKLPDTKTVKKLEKEIAKCEGHILRATKRIKQLSGVTPSID